LEERQNFDITELSNIKVRYPKVFAVFPRDFHVFVRFVDLTVDIDPHILPVHVEEHVQRNLLKKSMILQFHRKIQTSHTVY
jgi:hypothetical protein